VTYACLYAVNHSEKGDLYNFNDSPPQFGLWALYSNQCFVMVIVCFISSPFVDLFVRVHTARLCDRKSQTAANALKLTVYMTCASLMHTQQI